VSTRKTGVPITAKVLDWAIRESGFELDQVASSVRGGAETLDDWLKEKRLPTRPDLEKLARKLRRPTAVFFLPQPPKSRREPVAFRHPKQETRSTLNPSERRFLRYAQRLQGHLSWMLVESKANQIAIPSAALTEDPEEVGSRLREWAGLGIEESRRPRDNEAAFALRRDLIQSLGIVVCVLSVGRDSAQAFALSDAYAPVVVINSSGWNGASRSYSLFHELAHLMLRSDSACFAIGGRSRDYNQDGALEQWCNRVAAATLMPWDSVVTAMRQRVGLNPPARITRIDEASQLANALRVSLKAVVIRLIEHRAAGWDLWEQIPATSDSPSRRGGGGLNRAERRLAEVGRRAMSILLDGEARGVIARSNIRDLVRLGDLEIDRLRALVQ
jgi:Zn-dependent peptidase ImmA (M78 family)